MSKKKRRKKKGFGYYLYAIVSLLLLIVNITLASILLFHVQGIEVTGNTYSNKEELLSVLEEDPNTSNALYLLWKVNSGSYHKPFYLEKVRAKLEAPWKVELAVTERALMGCAASKQGYVFFDEEGYVLKMDYEMIDDIPVIEGIDVSKAELYTKLEGDYEHLFRSVSQLTAQLRKMELNPDRIVWEDDSLNVYFAKVCVRFGKSSYEEKVLQYTAIMDKLEGEDGILHLEHYGDTNKSISFEKNY